jgi:pimeloyl-ACP methyl ester carboxylesterase
MQPVSRTVAVNGLNLHLLDWDAGQPTTILYFPVYTGNAHDADRFAAGVADRYRVVAVDPRGHGDSDWGAPDSYTPANYVADANAVLDWLNVPKVILMGSSFGAATALKLAADRPDRTLALVMDDQPPELPTGRTVNPLIKSYERQKDDRFTSIDDVVAWGQAYRPATWGWNVSDDKVREWAVTAVKPAADGTLRWKHDAEILRCLAPFAGTPDADLRREFAAIDVPFLITRRTSEGGSLLSPVWEELQALNPRARYLSFPDAGHPVIWTQPEPFTGAVRTFLADNGL